MPTYRVATTVAVDPAVVFEAVAHLPGHAAWAADPIEIAAVDDKPVGVGKRYTSTATSKGKTFTADLVVTEYDVPGCFAFSAVDATGVYGHRFTITRDGTGAKVERVIEGDLTPSQRLLFALVYLPVKRPNARKAMTKLKYLLER
ncbi:MAG TPA: SRPBCC family protein [Mycobacteriales bacterium]|nr:SRPBCC family protein [Mycobacteriales bacterium]